MVAVYSFNGLIPVVHPEAFVHPSAVLIGDVHVGPRCYIGPCVSLRGDGCRIVIKAGSNVQDNCVVHGGARGDAVIEENGHIGHGAIIHGCHVGKGVLVGMNTVIMDMADIGEAAIIAANTFVKIGMQVPPRVMVAGNPGRVMRDLSEKEIAGRVRANLGYQKLAARSLLTMHKAESLTAPESGRQRVRADGTPISDKDFDEMVRASRTARGLS